MYEGEFKNGLFHGFGRFLFNNYVFYEGQWQQGKKHGMGTNHYQDGSQEIAQWDMDTLIKVISRKKKPPTSIMSGRQ